MAFPTTLFGKLKDITDQSTTQTHPLGTRLVMPDGRVFRYAKNVSTALTKGYLCATATQLIAETEDNAPSAAITTALRKVTVGITSTATATIAKDKFAEGYMIVHKGTGIGQVVQIKSNTTGGSSTGAPITAYFDDESYLSEALDTSTSKIGFVKNPYDGVVVCPAIVSDAPAKMPVGVPVCNISAGSTTPYYFWLQTWGPCAVVAGATVVEGALVRGGSSTCSAGEVIRRTLLSSGDAEGPKADIPQIGIVISGLTVDEMSLVFLTLAP